MKTAEQCLVRLVQLTNEFNNLAEKYKGTKTPDEIPVDDQNVISVKFSAIVSLAWVLDCEDIIKNQIEALKAKIKEDENAGNPEAQGQGQDSSPPAGRDEQVGDFLREHFGSPKEGGGNSRFPF